MKKDFQIIILSIFFGVLVWFSDTVFDYLFFYHGTFLDLLILDVPSHEVYFRTQVIIFFAFFSALLL